MRITMELENVFLNRLTQARADDNSLDFAECIDLSDLGCMKALMALQNLYQRRLEESLHKELASVQEDQKGTERTPLAQRKIDLPFTEKEFWELASGFEKSMQIPTFERRNLRDFGRTLQSKTGEDARIEDKAQTTYQHDHVAPVGISNRVHGSQIFSDSLEADDASIYTIDTIASRYSDAVHFQADQASIYHSEVNMFSIHCASDVRLALKDSDGASQISTRRIRPDYDQAMNEARPSIDLHRSRVESNAYTTGAAYKAGL